jgi:hypothetical protein
MAEVERDLERLLAGDQNVGFVPHPPGAATKAATAPRRWPLLAAGGAALVAAIAIDLGWPSKPPAMPAAAVPAVAPVAPTPPPVVAPPPAVVVAPPPAATVAPAHRKLRLRAEPKTAKSASPAEPATGKSREVRLPSGSKEAYPDK